MCKCTPEIRTPYCGNLGCEWPKPTGTRTTALNAVMQLVNLCAPWANWIAQDSQGRWWAFETLPSVETDEQSDNTDASEWWSPPDLTKFAMIHQGEINADWKTSLMEIERTPHYPINSAKEI